MTMTADLLQQIQSLQFSDKARAEALVLDFVRRTFPLDVVAAELRPLAVSLNSFNGFLTLQDRKRLFFKTHTEADTVIGEYYRAGILADAGYPVIQPLYSSTRAGQQLLIYEVIDDPSVFDVAWRIEMGEQELLPVLTQAQQEADDQLQQVYMNTLQWQSADAAGQAPVHQLFYHRITGGRLARFYRALPGESNGDASIKLPRSIHSMREVRQVYWQINGQKYDRTLDDLIANGVHLLQPARAGPGIVGHGDAHNGNVFFRQRDKGASLLYFDPAFAGRHHPLLDLAKPLFHNVFAMWMYFPLIKSERINIALERDGNTWHVSHDYALHPVRQMFLRSKVERVLIPILRELRQRNWLTEHWRDYLKAALFCCPLLTMNLTDNERFPPEMSLLGLAMAVEMGAESRGKRSAIDSILDEVSEAI
jgi:hypothetical protein